MKKILLCILIYTFACGYDFPALTHSFSADTLIKSSQINQNYSDLENGFKGNNKASFQEVYINTAGADNLVIDNDRDLTVVNGAISGTLAVTGTSSLTGASTLTGALTVNNNATISGTLAVTGTSTLTGATTQTGALTVNNNLTVTGNVATTGTLTQTGAISVDDTTDSTSGTTGSIHTDGGIGAVKDIVSGAAIKATDGISAGGNEELKWKVLDIGDWDMTGGNTTTVIHGQTLANIRAVKVNVRKDDGSNLIALDWGDSGSSASGSFSTDSDTVNLAATTSGIFDNSNYDDGTSYNRGWVMIWYE